MIAHIRFVSTQTPLCEARENLCDFPDFVMVDSYDPKRDHCALCRETLVELNGMRFEEIRPFNPMVAIFVMAMVVVIILGGVVYYLGAS